MSSSTASPSAPTYPSQQYAPRHASWPYTDRDFQRTDPSPDSSFYDDARFVTHIDDAAIATLREYYAHNLPGKGRILELCSSWVSHFPQELEERATATAKINNDDSKHNRRETGRAGDGGDGLEVVGFGMNAPELERNPILSRRILQDLNEQPTLFYSAAQTQTQSPSGPASSTIPTSTLETNSMSQAESLFDAATCVVSIDYLTQPVRVLASLRTHLKRDARVHLVISNRCFPTKAVGRWLRISEEERLLMVADYLWYAGYRDIEILTLSDGKAGVGAGSWGMLGRDPLWVVRGRNSDLERGGGDRSEL